MDPQTEKELLLAFHSPTAELAQALAGPCAVLRKARANKLITGLASNTPLPGFCHDLTLARLGLGDLLSFRCYSYELGLRKPDSEFFLHCLQAAGVAPREAIMLGDSLEADIRPASRLGMRTLQVTASNRDSEAEAIRQFEEALSE